MINENKKSPAVQLYELAMQYEGYQQGKSNLRYSHAKGSIVRYAVEYGLQFFEDDFKELPGCEEGNYAVACGSKREFENRSAALAMEKAWGRKPFLLRDPEKKTPERMYVGRWFLWFGGMNLCCTSFNDANKYFVACQYENNRCYGDKPVKVFKITHDDIKRFHQLLKDLFDKANGGKS